MDININDTNILSTSLGIVTPQSLASIIPAGNPTAVLVHAGRDPTVSDAVPTYIAAGVPTSTPGLVATSNVNVGPSVSGAVPPIGGVNPGTVQEMPLDQLQMDQYISAIGNRVEANMAPAVQAALDAAAQENRAAISAFQSNMARLEGMFTNLVGAGVNGFPQVIHPNTNTNPVNRAAASRPDDPNSGKRSVSAMTQPDDPVSGNRQKKKPSRPNKPLVTSRSPAPGSAGIPPPPVLQYHPPPPPTGNPPQAPSLHAYSVSTAPAPSDDLLSINAGSDLNESSDEEEDQESSYDTPEPESNYESDSEGEEEDVPKRQRLRSVVVQPTSGQTSGGPAVLAGQDPQVETGANPTPNPFAQIMDANIPQVVAGPAIEGWLGDKVKGTWITSLADDNVATIKARNLAPENAPYLRVQRTNQKVYDLVKTQGQQQDAGLQLRQDTVVHAANAAVQALQKLANAQVGTVLTEGTRTGIFQHVWDAFTLLSKVNNKIVEDRKFKLSRNVAKEYEGIRKTSFPEALELFGDDPDAVLDAVKKQYNRAQTHKKASVYGKGKGTQFGRPRQFTGAKSKNSGGLPKPNRKKGGKGNRFQKKDKKGKKPPQRKEEDSD